VSGEYDLSQFLSGEIRPGVACDMSADFLAEAKRRAQAAGLDIAFTQARAEALPYPDHSFEMLWAERVLIYVPEVRRAASEMRRVLRPGGRAALIEPDISTSTINLEDRALVRRVMGHEADSNVAHGWLPDLLRSVLEEVGFREIQLCDPGGCVRVGAGGELFCAMRTLCRDGRSSFRCGIAGVGRGDSGACYA
jgi:SAM-dependent methyltransferase